MSGFRCEPAGARWITATTVRRVRGGILPCAEKKERRRVEALRCSQLHDIMLYHAPCRSRVGLSWLGTSSFSNGDLDQDGFMTCPLKDRTVCRLQLPSFYVDGTCKAFRHFLARLSCIHGVATEPLWFAHGYKSLWGQKHAKTIANESNWQSDTPGWDDGHSTWITMISLKKSWKGLPRMVLFY